MSSFSVRCVEAFVMAFPGFFRFHFIWYDLRDVCCSTNLEFISLGSTIKPSTSTKFTSYKYKQQTSKWRKCLKRRREMCYYKQLEKLSAFSIAVELKQFLFQIVNGCLVWFVLHYSRYNLCVWKNLWMNQYINGSFFSDFLDVKNPFVCFISYSFNCYRSRSSRNTSETHSKYKPFIFLPKINWTLFAAIAWAWLVWKPIRFLQWIVRKSHK